MGLLHRHIFASVAGACAAAVGFFTFVLLTGQVLRELLNYWIAGQLGLGEAAWLTTLLLPYAAVYALPIGLLTAVLLVLGRMSSQQEITAMRAAGVGATATRRWASPGSPRGRRTRRRRSPAR